MSKTKKHYKNDNEIWFVTYSFGFDAYMFSFDIIIKSRYFGTAAQAAKLPCDCTIARPTPGLGS
eukprot:3918664-Amphidinium_carterae.1